MNQYQLRHVTEFHYDGPVSESYNEVRLRPMHDERQSCLSFRLSTSPAARATSYRDSYGNWVHQFNILAEHRRLAIEAESVVLAHETHPNGVPRITLREFDTQASEFDEEFFDFVSPTAYVPDLPRLQELLESAERASGGTVAGFAQAASDLIHEKFRYVKGATHVSSSVGDSLALGAGVCQDFAHLLLGILRRRGVPARYVSGYIMPLETAESGAGAGRAEIIGGQASHAWAEVYVPGAGWLGLDPTLSEPVGLRHVRLAYGRDYGDAAPVRGVYRGHAGQRLSVDVRVRPAVDDEGHEQLQKSAARPSETPAPDRPQQPELHQQQQQQQQQ